MLLKVTRRSFSRRPEIMAMFDEFQSLINGCMPLIKKQYDAASTPEKSKIVEFMLPSEIKAKLGDIGQQQSSIDECLKSIETVFKYSVNTMHPFFLDKLYHGTDPIG